MELLPATEQSDTAIVVRGTVAAPPAQVFALLADPARHPALDGSGMVRGAVDSEPLVVVGQSFTMDMHQPQLGDYRTVNTVLEVVPGERLAWSTARAGNPPSGLRWQWDLAPAAAGGTAVAHTYDWSGVTDPTILARVRFPRVSADQLRSTLDRLAAALI